MKLSTTSIAVLLTTLCLTAEPNASFPKVDDTSFTETNGNRVISLSVEVVASTNAVWRALTTAEGWKSFAVAFASMDMQIGGVLETSYNADARPGDPDNIKNQIVSYVPGRILVIRCIQAPRNFEHKQEFFATSTLLEIAPVGTEKSRVSLIAVGYRPGEAYDDLFKHFRWGDAYTLDKLRLRFETGRSTAPAETQDIKSFNTKPGEK